MATLPDTPSAAVDVDAINVVRAERAMLADSLDDFLANAARRVLVSAIGRERWDPETRHYARPVFGDDVAVAMNNWFPLDRLVDSAERDALAPPLRARVASVALARAIALQRDDAGVRAARVLRQLAPARRRDLDRYIEVPTSDARRVAGLYLLLRTPGMHVLLNTPDDDLSYGVDDPDVDFERLLHRNLWCDLDVYLASGKRDVGESEIVGLLYPGRRVAPPAFLTLDERATAEHELRAIAVLGAMRSYLGSQALQWARDQRRDVDVAEALRLTVRQWHFGCGEPGKWDIARQAFLVLHRRYPNSDAAKRTPFCTNRTSTRCPGRIRRIVCIACGSGRVRSLLPRRWRPRS